MRHLILLSLFLFSGACVELTPVRRTAIVPTAYLPARTGAPLNAKETRITGELSSVNSPMSLSPGLGDPGMLIPNLQAGGSVYHAFTSWLELGIQGRYASHHWATPNTEGVLPFPKSFQPDIKMLGAGMRLNRHVPGTRLSLSALSELNVTTIYQATYTCYAVECVDGDFVSSGELASYYDFAGYEQARVRFSNFFTQQTLAINSTLQVFSLFGAENHYKNVGFDTTVAHDPLSSYVMGLYGGGIEYQESGLSATATLFVPVTNERQLAFGPSLQLMMGLRF